MADIVRGSGVSAGLVYRYFASKDDLITAIVADWHAERRALVRPDQDVAELTAAYLDLLPSTADPRNRIGVQAWAETLRSPQIRDLARDGVDELRATVAGVLDRGDADALAPHLHRRLPGDGAAERLGQRGGHRSGGAGGRGARGRGDRLRSARHAGLIQRFFVLMDTRGRPRRRD
jgi:AcrR family transcriptional regulator